MDYVIPPVIVVLVLRYAFPALMTWLFTRFVEPKVEIARQENSSAIVVPPDVSNALKIVAARKILDELKHRLDKTEGH